MARRLLGTGTTDEQGIVSIPYTGKGLGILQLQASVGITFYFNDKGTASYHNDSEWTTWSTYPVTVTHETDYTKLTQATSGTTAFRILPFSNWDLTTIEFDFYKNGGALNEIIFQLRDSSRSVLRQVSLSTWSNTSLNTWYHFKLDFKNKKIYLDDNVINMNDISPSALYLACYSTTTDVRYRNLVVYRDLGDGLTSETYELIDAQFISDGNLNCSANGQVTINNDIYTLGLIDTSSYGFVYYSTSNIGSNSWIWLSEGNTTEFEILDKTGTVSIRFDGTLSNDTIWTVNITTGKVRIVHNGSTVSIYVDGELVTSANISREDKNPRFRINAGSITIKNWLHY